MLFKHGSKCPGKPDSLRCFSPLEDFFPRYKFWTGNPVFLGESEKRGSRLSGSRGHAIKATRLKLWRPACSPVATNGRYGQKGNFMQTYMSKRLTWMSKRWKR